MAPSSFFRHAWCVVLLVLAAAAVAQPATLYVSPQGREGARGTIDDPFPSLTAARDAIRSMRKAGATEPATVLLRGGTYRLTETFVLTPEDSGVTYEAYPAEHPVISGGRVVKGWQKGAGSIWTTYVSDRVHQLFINGQRAVRARTPNSGFFRIDGPSSQDKPFTLKFRGDEIKASWAGNSDVEVVALLAWAELRMPITAVDESAHIARFAADPKPSNQEANARYWIENAPDALDSPGEWRFDSKAGTIYYWPKAGEDLSRDEVVAPALMHLVRLEGSPEKGAIVRDVTIRGLDFRHADWAMPSAGYAETQAAMSAPSAFEAIGAEGLLIEHCSFSESGGYAIWLGRGCRRNRVSADEIFDMGAGGIKIGDAVLHPDQANWTFENVVTDNAMHDLGRVYPSAIGVWVGQSSRNTISHNHIHDLFYTAVSVGWTWGYDQNQCTGNIIEFNHLHDIGKNMLSDMGAIYTLGIQPGTVIRNNLIHDVQSFTYGGWGIYPDEGSSNILIENNIVYRTKSAGFHQHYGRENIVRNNIFAFGAEHQLMRTRAEPHLSFTFEGNIVYYDSGALLGSNWTGDGFRMNRNVYWDARDEPVLFAGQTLAEWQQRGQDQDSQVANPGFVNASSYDFRLMPDSPAWKMGFKEIDMSTVGPRVAPGVAGLE